MRNAHFAMLAMMAGLTAAAPAHAAGGQGDSTVSIQPSMSLVKSADLDFGTVIAGTTAGTVTINAGTGTRTTSGGITAIGSGHQRAQFLGTAPVGVIMFVTLPASVTLARSGGGAPNMTATLTRSSSGLITLGPISLLSNAGVQTHNVGGTLSVGANQLAGTYSGTFTFTANYL